MPQIGYNYNIMLDKIFWIMVIAMGVSLATMAIGFFTTFSILSILSMLG